MLINKYIFQIMALLALIMMNPQEPSAQTNEEGDLFTHAMATEDFNNDGILVVNQEANW